MATIKKLIEIADDAYYAADYERAIQFYRQVLDQDPDNQHARRQLKKSEINLPSKESGPQDLPKEALRYYKRSRSFIAAGDLTEAKKLLKTAIKIAEDAGVDFEDARSLLKGIQSAVKAAEFKSQALSELEDQQWGKAEADLISTCDLDPTDEASKLLLDHLQKLVRAKGLLDQLMAEISDKKKEGEYLKEIQETIENTNQTAILSKLWQEVVRLRGVYAAQVKKTNTMVKESVWGTITWYFLLLIMVVIGVLSSLYLLPRSRPVVDCSKENGLKVTVNYPNYIANGDSEDIFLTVENVGTETVSGYVLLDFEGTSEGVFLDKDVINLEDLMPSEHMPKSEIDISMNELFRPITSPGQYLDFTTKVVANDKECISRIFHIDASPIYGLRTLIKFLWGTIGLTLIGLFWDRIKELLALVLRRKSSDQ